MYRMRGVCSRTICSFSVFGMSPVRPFASRSWLSIPSSWSSRFGGLPVPCMRDAARSTARAKPAARARTTQGGARVRDCNSRRRLWFSNRAGRRPRGAGAAARGGGGGKGRAEASARRRSGPEAVTKPSGPVGGAGPPFQRRDGLRRAALVAAARRAGPLALCIGREAHLLDLLEQRGAVEPEQLRGLVLVPVRLLERAQDEIGLEAVDHLVEGDAGLGERPGRRDG